MKHALPKRANWSVNDITGGPRHAQVQALALDERFQFHADRAYSLLRQHLLSVATSCPRRIFASAHSRRRGTWTREATREIRIPHARPYRPVPESRALALRPGCAHDGQGNPILWGRTGPDRAGARSSREPETRTASPTQVGAWSCRFPPRKCDVGAYTTKARSAVCVRPLTAV
jgi:hypothetical protein